MAEEVPEDVLKPVIDEVYGTYTFFPTPEQFRREDFLEFLHDAIEHADPHGEVGIVLVTPPKECKKEYLWNGSPIPEGTAHPKVQKVFGDWEGILKIDLSKNISVPELQLTSLLNRAKRSKNKDLRGSALARKVVEPKDLVECFLRLVRRKNVKIGYSTDFHGDLFDKHELKDHLLNLNKKVPGDLLRELLPAFTEEKWVDVITTTYIYIGEAGSAFPMHVEDFCAVSVNYLVKGAWKVWMSSKLKHNALFME
jgi:hypothetical protein